MSDKKEKEGSSFKVTDKRMSFEENDVAETAPEKPKVSTDQKTEEDAIKDNEAEDTTAEKAEKSEQKTPPVMEINFATFILSLSGSVMLQIGEIPNPETGKTEKNLPLAKQSMDILEMLKEKTKGNLEADEVKLLDNVLYDLRMRYVNAAKS